MDPIYASIIGLVFIILVVFTVLSAKTWHWVNIVFVNLTFLAGVGAAVGLTQVYELRSTQLQQLKDSEEELEKNKRLADLAVYGSPLSVAYDRESLRGINHELSLQMIGRGRVWSGGTVAAAGENRSYQFATPRSEEAVEQTKLKDVLLYAFADGVLGGQALPATYIGTVMVEAESATSLTLRPIFIAQLDEWAQPTTTWSLFEKMPQDRHHTFKMGIIAEVDANPASSEQLKQFADSIRLDEMEIAPFRQILQARYLTPQLVGMDPTSAEYEALIDRYAFDGMSLGKIDAWVEANSANRVNKQFQPDPDEVFVKYKFEKNSKRPHKVDADGSISADGQFSQLGEAIDPSLQVGGDGMVTFEEGDTVIVDQRSAEGYQRGEELVPPFKELETDASGQSIVTEVDRIYYRELRDYPYLLTDISTQTEEISEEIARIQAGTKVQEKALADTQRQLEARTKTIAGLQQDNSNLKKDSDVVQSLYQERDESVTALKSRIARLKQDIDQRYARIQELTREIERRAFAGG